MLQDKLRSVVYRTFVTCDDPKGVVECGTIRKSINGGGKPEPKIDKQKTKDTNTSSAGNKLDRERMVSKEEFLYNPSSLQLLEVSKGAKKLNQVIDSWSKGLSYDAQPEDIAKDLLQGALHLQDSLLMLNKLQEASHFRTKLKKNQENERRIERTKSDQFRDRNYDVGYQKARLSVDGSSRDCHEDLRKVIKDSLLRQNLLPHHTRTKDCNFYHRGNLDSAFDIPSTSSSQSSMVHTNNFSSNDSLSSTSPLKNAKGPTLIAKLMGLDDIPAKQPRSRVSKQLETEKISNQQSTIFDIDKPKFSKPTSTGRKEDHEPKTLKEILETMQYKALLKNKTVKDLESNPGCRSLDYHSNQRLTDNFPPIVLIRPRGFSDELETQKFEEDGAMNTVMMSANAKGEDRSSKKIDRNERANYFNKTSRKIKPGEGFMTKLNQEGPKGCRGIDGQPMEKQIKNKQKAPVKMKDSNKITQQPQRVDVNDRKSSKTVMVTVATKQPVQKYISKSRTSSVPSDQVKVTTPPKAKNPESGANVAKKRIPQQRSSTPTSISNCKSQSIVHSSSSIRKNSFTKKKKTVSEPIRTNSTIEILRCKEDQKVTNLTSEHGFIHNTTLEDPISTKEETDFSEFLIGEYSNNSESPVCNDVLPNSENEKDVEEFSKKTDAENENKAFQTEVSLKRLLLMSPSFLNHVRELFDLDMSCATTTFTSGNGDNEFMICSEKLLVDCANELIERKKHADSGEVHVMLSNSMDRIGYSIDLLLEEVCDGVDILKAYSELDHDNHLIDRQYAMLVRDLTCRGVTSGIWSLGWRNGFSVDDRSQVVNEIEALIMSALIEEVLS